MTFDSFCFFLFCFDANQKILRSERCRQEQQQTNTTKAIPHKQDTDREKTIQQNKIA